ncbi:MAG: hypothetical protein ACOCXZ_04140, partial [Chloroflexota bacterium]
STITATTEAIDFIVRDFYSPLWEGRAVPEWFRAGLVAFYQPQDKLNLALRARSQARNAGLIPLARMDDPALIAADPLAWQAQAYMMVLYIADSAGTSGLYELASGGDPAAGVPFAQDYLRITGQPLDALLPALQNWVFSAEAERHAGLFLYAGPTEAPSPTLTVTPFPLTATNTPTATTTATPTPTVTGFLTATPLATITPSPTITPGTPTITPLPPDFSVMTVVAPPGDSDAAPLSDSLRQDTAETDNTALILTLALAGVIVLGGLIAALILRRRLSV